MLLGKKIPDKFEVYNDYNHNLVNLFRCMRDCPEIRELYQGYEFFDFKRVHSMVQKYEAGREFPELLVGNYDLYEKEREKPRQLSFLELQEEPCQDVERILREGILSGKK